MPSKTNYPSNINLEYLLLKLMRQEGKRTKVLLTNGSYTHCFYIL